MFLSSIPLYIKNASGFFKIIKQENVFRKKYQLKKLDLMDLFINLGDEILVFTPEEFQPFSKTFSRHVHFVGTTIKNRIPLLQEETKCNTHDYYISMGSIFTKNLLKNIDILQKPIFAKMAGYFSKL